MTTPNAQAKVARPLGLSQPAKPVAGLAFERLVMPAMIVVDANARCTRATIQMSDGRDIAIRVVARPGMGEVVEIQGDGGILVRPSSTNQVQIAHCDPAPCWVTQRA